MLFPNSEEGEAETTAKLHYIHLRNSLKCDSFHEHFHNLNIIFKGKSSLRTNKLIFILLFPNLKYCHELHTLEVPSLSMPNYSYEDFFVKFYSIFGGDDQENNQKVSFELLDDSDGKDDYINDVHNKEEYDSINFETLKLDSHQSNSWIKSNMVAIKNEDIKNNRLFQCKNCGVPYVSKSRMLKHMKECHEKKQINKIILNNTGNYKVIEILDLENDTDHIDVKCGSCGKVFSSETVAIRHEVEICQNLERIHRIKHPIFSCSKCSKYLMGTQFLKYHLHHVHECVEKYEIRNDIEDCISVVGEVLSTDAIMNIIKYGQTEQCAICKKKFPTYDDMKKHIEDTHPKFENKNVCNETGIKVWVCKVCCNMFEDHNSYTTHSDTHSNDSHPKSSNFEQVDNEILIDEKIAFECPICSDSFEESLEFNTHLELHKNNKENLNIDIGNPTVIIKDTDVGNSSFSCATCKKSYQTRDCLVTHEVEVHGDVKKFARIGGRKDRVLRKCKYCTKLFLHPSKLRDHTRIHTQEQDFQCSKCDETFTTKKMVIKHELGVHGIDSDGSFNKRGCKKKANTYICTYCSKAFSAPAYLLQHERTHTKERPFKCLVCEKTFGTKSNMKVHVKTHQKEKKLTCCYCEYKTNNKRYLKTHIQTHTGTTNHTCAVCGDAFKTYHSMWKHKRLCTTNKLSSAQEDDKKADTNEDPTLIAIEAYDDTETLLHSTNNVVNDAVKTILLTDNLEMDSAVVTMEVVKENLNGHDKNTGEIFVQEDGIIYETVLFDQ